jgi:hypothetical protein
MSKAPLSKSASRVAVRKPVGKSEKPAATKTKPPAKTPPAKAGEHVQYHKDGSLWARGPLSGGLPHGFWEWFRKDGTKLRSGSFDKGLQTGDWTTYDKDGEVYKVTPMGTKAKASPKAERQSTPKSAKKTAAKKVVRK